MKTYNFYTDPGHGWLAVKIKELVDLNIVDKITKYSYIKGSTAYLEEDCDLAMFFKAYREKYGIYPVYKNISTEKTHYIRSYDHYSMEEVNKRISLIFRK